ncbi:MAG: hypothetical protein MUE73_05175 [Planctomycetes bacterium]|nr:hypothetical protein [Planctomycetota bacterium]
MRDLLARAGLALCLALAAGPGLAAGGRGLRLADATAGVPGLEVADCREVVVEETDAGLAFAVTMGGPIEKGIFTCVHVYVDGDGNPETGIGGSELWFRAAVGSRFRPLEFRPDTPGVPAPLSLARLSYSVLTDMEDLSAGTSRKNWLNHNLRGVPVLSGPTMRFTVPARLVQAVADRYGAAPALRVQVETSCADQPLFVEYRAVDDGLPIRVDGDAREWSGGPSASDAGGELYEPLRCLDLTRLRVDHEANRLFVTVDTDAPGFDTPLPASTDLMVSHSIVVLVEPLDSAYDSPKRLTIFRGRASSPGQEDAFAMKDRTVEAAISRRGFEGRLRVLAWSEATHRDMVPDKDTVPLRGK